MAKKPPHDTLLSHFARPDDELKHFRSCLRWIFMDQSSTGSKILSWVLFFLLAVIMPTISHFVLSYRAQRRPYDAAVQFSLSSASMVSFLCLSSFVRRYGLRRFLFLDNLGRRSGRIQQGYTAQLNRSFRILSLFVFPCFFLEIVYKIWWYYESEDKVPWLGNEYLSDIIACLAELISWLYRTAIYFLTCVIFRLICYLENLRLQDFAGVFGEQTAVEDVLKEHLDIRKQLKKISHRFRIFIISCLFLVSASQFVSVLLTTRKNSADNLFNTGELALCSIVLVAGLLIILRSAAKITHQAQALTGHAAKWHACATIGPSKTENETETNVFSDMETTTDEEMTGDDDEEVLENTDFVGIHPHVTITFQKRQALVAYLENNRAGITVFGFTLDRAYLHTIFMLECTLFLWLLGKTIGFS